MEISISILLIVIGVAAGFAGDVIIRKIRKNHAENKAEQIKEKRLLLN